VCKDERGSILIEFVGSFLIFVLMIISILSLVNIVTAQARMHYALTQTANTLSMYGYILHVTNIDGFMMGVQTGADTVNSEANQLIDDINEVLSGINNLDLAGIQKGAEGVQGRVGSWVVNTIKDPICAIQIIMQYGLSELESAGFELILRELMKYYLSNGDMDGDEYLKSVGINSDLEFYTFSLPGYVPAQPGQSVGSVTNIPDDNSVLLDANGNVRITVQYKIDYWFYGLQLPFSDSDNIPRLSMVQSVITKMWLGGSGDGYKK